jgi:RHS repeat-associated protein
MTDGTSTYLYCYDGNGNVGQMVDTSGSLVANYQYDPFGKTISADETLTSSNPFRFSTKYLDVETGLYYYGYRYYSSELGRWLSRDPIGESFNINIYAFISNNPNSFLDPFGLYGIDIHMGLTHYLALKAGFCPDMAAAVAKMNQSVDYLDQTDPLHQGAKYFMSFKLSQKAREALRKHFPIDPRAAEGTTVERNSEYVRNLMGDAIKQGDPYDFGRLLHTYQDSWSHEGYIADHASDGTTPDKTWIRHRYEPGNRKGNKDWGRDFQMAFYTYYQLRKFLDENPWFCVCQKPETFPEEFVVEYLKEKDLRKKERLLRQEGLTDYAVPSNNEIYYKMEDEKYHGGVFGGGE